MTKMIIGGLFLALATTGATAAAQAGADPFLSPNR